MTSPALLYLARYSSKPCCFGIPSFPLLSRVQYIEIKTFKPIVFNQPAFTPGSVSIRRPRDHAGQWLSSLLLRCPYLMSCFPGAHPNPHAETTMGLALVWTLFLDLSGVGDPTRDVKTPTGIALGVNGTHKPLSRVKATVQVSG